LVLKRRREKPTRFLEWWQGDTQLNTVTGWLALGASAVSLCAIPYYGLLSDFSLSAMVGAWALAYYFIFHYLVRRKAKLKPWAFVGLLAMVAGYWLFTLTALLLTVAS